MNSILNAKYNLNVEGNLDAKQTLVFAHGFGTDQTAWNAVKKAFLGDYRLILYDNIGAGHSDPNAYSPIKYNSLNSYAQDMVNIIEGLELENAIIIAHSVSSMIAVLAAVKVPERISRLVLIGASPRYLNDESEIYMGGFTQEVLDGMYTSMTTNYYAWASGFSSLAMGNPDKPELGIQFAQTLSAIRPDIALSVAKVIFESDVRKDLTALKKQTLLLQTLNDIAVPAAVADYLHEHIDGSTLKVLNATGHLPHISAPEEVIAAIKSFI